MYLTLQYPCYAYHKSSAMSSFNLHAYLGDMKPVHLKFIKCNCVFRRSKLQNWDISQCSRSILSTAHTSFWETTVLYYLGSYVLFWATHSLSWTGLGLGCLSQRTNSRHSIQNT